jgi:hypothetical protein
MCFNCSDFVDQCGAEGCYNPNGGPYRSFKKFYIGDTYCEHLKKKYGHELAEWEDVGIDEH